MKNKFQRMIDRYLGIPLCALLSLVSMIRKKTTPSSSPKKILIILLSEMGSIVLAHPMFMRLKEKYPEASLYILSFSKNKELITLLNVMPEENILILDDGAFFNFLLGSINMIRTLRSMSMDVVIDCELFSRVSSLLSYLSGAPRLVGFHRHTQEGLYRGTFINQAVTYNPYRHLTQQFLTMVDAIESAMVPSTKCAPIKETYHPPLLPFSEEKRDVVFNELHHHYPAIKHKKMVLIYPGGGLLPLRAWPIEQYCQLTAALIDEDFAVGVIGLKEDQPLAQRMVSSARSPYCIDLTGYTKSIMELLMLFHRASLLITNDGGPGHLAALTTIPSIVFFGPETPILYKPLGKKVYPLYLSLPCSPCLTAYNHRTSPCDGDNQCLKRISLSQVLAKAREILAPPN